MYKIAIHLICIEPALFMQSGIHKRRSENNLIHRFIGPIQVYFEDVVSYHVLQVRCFVSGILGLPVINYLGWQTSTVLGTILSFVGLLCSSYVQSFYLIYLTFGIITGE